jgi:hypothetical protein
MLFEGFRLVFGRFWVFFQKTFKNGSFLVIFVAKTTPKMGFFVDFGGEKRLSTGKSSVPGSRV